LLIGRKRPHVVLPINQSQSRVSHILLDRATALGLTVPASMLLLADQVIE
jgi:hypothetical protein